jgi:CHAT domain-containing protein
LELLATLDEMPGTADEMKRLEKLAPPGSQLLQNEKANERALSSLAKAPAVLHLGCHAFFLADDLSPATKLDFDEHADLLHAGGLLLHGAALRKADSPVFAPDDDLLYPAEVAKLPLQGSRLVTLSSCESGAGTAVSGEGLLGLRRGFALAGAREVVVALWPVSDRSTPGFMERFYQLALASDRPAQALWQCQREFLAKATSDDDFEAAVLRYAPFVLSQNTPLATGGEIAAAATKPGIPWKKLALALPLLVFIASRLFKRRAA